MWLIALQTLNILLAIGIVVGVISAIVLLVGHTIRFFRRDEGNK